MSALADLITPSLRDLIVLSIMLHNERHGGLFSECADAECASNYADLRELIAQEEKLDAIRRDAA